MNFEFEKLKKQAENFVKEVDEISDKAIELRNDIDKFKKRMESREVSCSVEKAKHGFKVKIPSSRAKLGNIKKDDIVGVRKIR